MRLGIKYCGGCNPRYDRVGAVEALRARFPALTVFHAEADRPMDLVLVVCGCPARCTSPAGAEGAPVLWLTGEEELPELFAEIASRMTAGA